ncbi:prolyl oligopeptidase family serine peptidase [Chitinophaga sp. Mgbs1]|uniref:Prolyl oligopeptidase family serine peptidase n=1 Tax=Chitinophaga solisilvae TaxID=1233460 RepID=A0A3S1CYT4_9BACT|nr:prolyl oligopeptidase family serine peptidase [Chitinophaga solisilvae]
MRYLHLLLSCLLLTGGMRLTAQDFSQYSNEAFYQKGDTLRYRLLMPANYDTHKKYPLIVFLHGSGERGWDNNAQLLHGGELFLRDSIRNKYPAFVLFPQCPGNTTWAPMNFLRDSTGKIVKADFPADAAPTVPGGLVISLLDSLARSGKIDNKRIYIGGLSLGGMGTFYLITRRPDLFAAAFPICGAGNVATADRFAKKVPLWIFHGDDDKVVPVEASRAYNEKLKSLGVDVKYTEYEGVGHNSWDNAFHEPELVKWLMEHKRK